MHNSTLLILKLMPQHLKQLYWIQSVLGVDMKLRHTADVINKVVPKLTAYNNNRYGISNISQI